MSSPSSKSYQCWKSFLSNARTRGITTKTLGLQLVADQDLTQIATARAAEHPAWLAFAWIGYYLPVPWKQITVDFNMNRHFAM